VIDKKDDTIARAILSGVLSLVQSGTVEVRVIFLILAQIAIYNSCMFPNQRTIYR